MNIKSNEILEQNILNSLYSSIICQYCDCVFNNPIYCKHCGNIMCFSCFEKYMKHYREKKDVNNYPCLCGKNANYKKTQIISEILLKIHFKCRNNCGKILKYSELNNHYLKDCEKIDYSLLYENLFKEFNDLKIKYDKLVEDNNTINIITKYHVHPLSKCRLDRATYICNKCLKEYNGFIPSYYCSLCDYDLCESCGRIIKNLSVDY